jgi:hypothetical protein
MNTRAAALLFTAVLAQGAQSDGKAKFCAVELSVTLPDGSPIISATAELLNAEAVVVQRQLITNGSGTFCDFGFGPHSIRVGHGSSLTTTISGIKLIFGQTQHLRVVLNSHPEAGSGGAVGTACRALLRLQSPNGDPIAGVTVTYRGNSAESDNYGRVLLLVPLKQFTAIAVQKVGFQSKDLSLSCSEPYEFIERNVYLLRAAPRE